MQVFGSEIKIFMILIKYMCKRKFTGLLSFASLHTIFLFIFLNIIEQISSDINEIFYEDPMLKLFYMATNSDFCLNSMAIQGPEKYCNISLSPLSEIDRTMNSSKKHRKFQNPILISRYTIRF